MAESNFWDCVKRACENLEIPDATFRTMKHRGRVSREKAIPIYQTLKGTEHEISLESLQADQPATGE